MSWRRTKEYRRWRILVIRRDKVCQLCGSKKHRNAHHMNCGSYHPEDRFDVDNGVTLCGSCHSNYHNNYHRSYRTKCTKYDYKNFLSLFKYIRSLTIV